jgi:hypothetical protein
MIGVLWAAAILLAAAGLGKLLRPAATARAMVAAELPAASWLSALPVVRCLGVTELAVGAWVLVGGGVLPAVLMSVSYLFLTVVAARMLQVAPGQDCGCFGSESEPIGVTHVVVNAAGLLVAGVAAGWPAAFSGLPSVPDVLVENAGEGALVLVLAALLGWLSYLLMTALPALLALRAKVSAAR